MSAAPSKTCSFCGKTKSDGPRVIVKGKSARICDRCAKWCASEHAPVAYCTSCTVVDGAHAVDCPVWRSA
jgi:hypothetical protein